MIMPDALDRLLAIGSAPDWISPLATIIRDFTNGPHHHFFADMYSGWSVNDVTNVLKRKGIDVWGAQVLDDMIVFTVRENQAKWAQYLLEHEGAPLIGGFIYKPATNSSRTTPKKQPSPDEIDEFLDQVGRWFVEMFS
jgi:hypothetical protein